MPFSGPDHCVGLMVHDDGDVLVSFLVAGFIDADVDKVIQPDRSFRLDFIQSTGNTAAHGLPVNAHVLSYCIPRKVDCKPSNRQVKVLCEVASRICPWYVSDDAAMLRTLDALGLTLNLNEDASKVETTPYSNVLGRTAILGAFLPTKGAAILVLLIRPRLYPEVLHTSSIGIIFSGLDHCVLDIQQIFD